MATDTIVLTIQWDGNVEASVHFVTDNDDVVEDGSGHIEGYSPVTVRYDTAADSMHVIEGSLWFPGDTVRKLVVKATINGGPPASVDAQDADTKNQWSWRGVVP